MRNSIVAINGKAANDALIGSFTHPEMQGEIVLKVKYRSDEREFIIPILNRNGVIIKCR